MFAGHLKDLAERSYEKNLYTFTNFLDEAQTGLLLSMKKELSYAGLALWGGTEHADRCMVRFGNEESLGYSQLFPIACLQVEPVMEKFGEILSHRDYLGALMNAGIDRDLLGDIYVQGKTAYVFCVDHIAEYIADTLRTVRHTDVTVSILESVPTLVGPVLEERVITAASERIDAVISRVFNLSRSQSMVLFAQGKVFVNGIQTTNNSVTCHPQDKISVRGNGKFIYDGAQGLTGKGRCRIQIRVYK